MANNKPNIYIIPENFIEGGRLFNGMFKTRNFVEAVILSLIVGVPLWMINYPSIQVKVTVLIIFVLPIFLVSVIGINDNSFIEFLQQFFKWRKRKRVMLYNGQTRSRAVRPAEVILSQEIPKDKLVEAVGVWKDNRKKHTKVSYVEGKDFIFMDDEDEKSTFVSTEKKILEQKASADKTTEKKNKKKKTSKSTHFLTETNNETETPVKDDDDVVIISNDDIEVTADEDDTDEIILDVEVE